MHYKPDGYNSASPYLLVPDAAALLRFLEAVFSAQPLRRIDGEGGRIRHAEVRIDDTVVMLADALPDWPAVPSNIHVYVSDVDATYARAIAAGGISVQAPMQKGDEDKRGGVSDMGGNTWWIATQVG